MGGDPENHHTDRLHRGDLVASSSFRVKKDVGLGYGVGKGGERTVNSVQIQKEKWIQRLVGLLVTTVSNGRVKATQVRRRVFVDFRLEKGPPEQKQGLVIKVGLA